MRIGIVAFFCAPLGGLQENIRSTALYARERGHTVIVMTPPGAFVESLKRDMIEVQSVEYGDEQAERAAIEALLRVDVIHAHPGPSRMLALAAADLSRAPLFFTIHGAWFDAVESFAERLNHVVCVSEAIKGAVSRLIPKHTGKIRCVPNGVDVDRFSQSVAKADRKYIAVVSRFDVDKREVIKLMNNLWEAQGQLAECTLHWRVAGDGTLMSELHEAADRLRRATGRRLVEFLGWLGPDELNCLYGGAAVAVASGRAAMEALAAGTPVVAVGSGGTAPVLEADSLEVAARANFGGFGTLAIECDPEALILAIKARVLWWDEVFSRHASQFIRGRFDNNLVNQVLLAMYAIACERS